MIQLNSRAAALSPIILEAQKKKGLEDSETYRKSRAAIIRENSGPNTPNPIQGPLDGFLSGAMKGYKIKQGQKELEDNRAESIQEREGVNDTFNRVMAVSNNSRLSPEHRHEEMRRELMQNPNTRSAAISMDMADIMRKQQIADQQQLNQLKTEQKVDEYQQLTEPTVQREQQLNPVRALGAGMVAAAQEPYKTLTAAAGRTVFNNNQYPHMPLERSTSTDIQNQLMTGGKYLMRLDQIGQQVRPEDFTYAGKTENFLNASKEKLGVELSPEQQARMARKTQAFQGIEQLFNEYRKHITGAAASEKEMEQLRKTVLNTDLSYTEFQAAFNNFKDTLLREQQFNQNVSRNGIYQGQPGYQEQLQPVYDSGTIAPPAYEQQITQGQAQPIQQPQPIRVNSEADITNDMIGQIVEINGRRFMVNP